MIDPVPATLFKAAPLPGVEAGDGACDGGFAIEVSGVGVDAGESEGAVGGAGGEEAGAEAGGEVPVEGAGETPAGAGDEDGVDAGGVATAVGGAAFGDDAGGGLVGEEAGAAPGAWPKEPATKANSTKNTKAEEAMAVKNAQRREENGRRRSEGSCRA
ncbi:circumsporozoite protein-like [Momordica charantia]|uniref:Circumsporozoite protein-like n=1 Tax=Momordica charantia TaxID=3673 RepID=A0A6J1C301_MOMCH|nr:circumsporozoite protein-like [Momordica charantia]